MITKKFAQHSTSPGGGEAITDLRRAYSVLEAILNELVPNSREKSIALTDLETSAMWAIKGVAHNEPEGVAHIE